MNAFMLFCSSFLTDKPKKKHASTLQETVVSKVFICKRDYLCFVKSAKQIQNSCVDTVVGLYSANGKSSSLSIIPVRLQNCSMQRTTNANAKAT